MNKVIGIIGGLGPLASAYLYNMIIRKTDANTDQEHIDMIIINAASTPDRTAYLLDNSLPSPIEKLVQSARNLEYWGVDIIIMPCNTAHYFYEEITKSINIPMINMIEETAKAITKKHIRKVGLLTTDGVIKTKIFQKYFDKYNIEIVIPEKDYQKEIVNIIYDIKGNKKIDIDNFYKAADFLIKQGCEAIVLGCTELSVIKQDYNLDDKYIDPMEILAIEAIEFCGKQIKAGQ